jgi:hypothetical protein
METTYDMFISCFRLISINSLHDSLWKQFDYILFFNEHFYDKRLCISLLLYEIQLLRCLFVGITVVKQRKNLEWKLKLLDMSDTKTWFAFWGSASRELTGILILNYTNMTLCIVSAYMIINNLLS